MNDLSRKHLQKQKQVPFFMHIWTYASREQDELLDKCYRLTLSGIRGLERLLRDFCQASKDNDLTEEGEEVDEADDLPHRVIEMLAAEVSHG